MIELLFAFTAQGVAEPSSCYRPGARHPLMIFATARTIEDAQSKAAAHATEEGWSHVSLKRGKEISGDTTLISDESLRAAADAALQSGASIVVYRDEIPLDS